MTGLAQHDVTVHQGDALDVLRTLPDQSVQCIVTSPPYYGLRDYGTGRWEGGDPDCDHLMPALGGTKKSGLNAKRDADGYLSADGKSQPNRAAYPNVCEKCRASRVDKQLGLESSPAEYVAAMVGVFREARRVLADDGTFWLNIGDSYSSAPPGKTEHAVRKSTLSTPGSAATMAMRESVRTANIDRTRFLPEKNLMGIPWRVAFGLQDDGWTLRNAIIWNKPNAMPESVTDRLSGRYEHVFLFSKSRRYWFDLDAIKEAPRESRNDVRAERKYAHLQGGANSINETGWRVGPVNPGDVWTIPTSPFPGAHFACMPPELARRCILAGCPERGTVLDPFTGSGTTAMVARQLGRKFTGSELNCGYFPIIEKRIGQEPFEFEVTA